MKWWLCKNTLSISPLFSPEITSNAIIVVTFWQAYPQMVYTWEGLLFVSFSFTGFQILNQVSIIMWKWMDAYELHKL